MSAIGWAASKISKALPEYTVYATDDIVRLHPDGGITTIARSGNATQRWRILKAGIEIGDAPTPQKPAQAFENVFVEMGWSGVNGATSTLTAGNAVSSLPSKGGIHSEMRNFAALGAAIKGQDVEISDVLALNNPDKTLGVCAECRLNMFEPLIRLGARSITLPYTTGNKVKDTIMIVANDFETVRDEIQVIIDKYKSLKDSLGRDLNTYEYTLRSDAVWEVLLKYNKK